ncbi:Ribokinase-like protein [Acrodontium crateriforme]|uniref:Ribokinase-like protein n=1 Tax=Acrodontium crateriforme TaxID=150365 RepID=A0AAQ3M0M6_9PEZI|nr:Ribokinase-like protein [Acrodontium crateriforme]
MGIDFVTLGMFIIDDIYPPPTAADQTPQKDIIGGAGTYSAIGARLFSPPPKSKSVGWIVDTGTDFPADVHETITSWQTGVLMRPRDALTTRGWNGYGENDHRAFKYLTEKKRLTADDLTPELLASRSFHLICSPNRCIEIVKRILERRKESLGAEFPRPLIIWEPVPDLCIPSELENTFAALAYVDVISPNHEELGQLLSGVKADGVDKRIIEEQAQQLLVHGIGPAGKGLIVVRASKEGAYVASPFETSWFPAYHTDSTKVIDPTGGGNGFLGGFAVGLVRNENATIKAAQWGSIAASFCIEQVGMPALTPSTTPEVDHENWNGHDVLKRLEEYNTRMFPANP